MANIKSAIKRNKTNEKARLRNRAVRSEMRTREKTALEAAGTENEAEALKAALKRIDKATQKGVLHKNTAARKKSRLVKAVKAAAAEG